MKSRILFFIILSFSVLKVKAQMYGYTRAPSSGGTIPLSGYTYNRPPMNYNPGSSSSSKYKQPDKKYSLKVTLLNDSVYKTKAAFHYSKNKPYIFIKNSDNTVRKVYAYQTKNIVIELNDSKLIGISHDSCWLFKADFNTDDKIIKYAMLPENQLDDDVTYMQLNGDENPIQPVTKENLLEIVKDDKELVKIVNKDKLVKAINNYNKKESQ